MGTHQPQLHTLWTFILLCCFTVPARTDAHGSEVSEIKEQFTNKLNELIYNANKSSPQCNFYIAKMCFMKMANVTMEAVIKEDGKDDYCREADRMSSCVEWSMSGCPSEYSWPGLQVIHPFVSLLKAIKSTVCSPGFRNDEKDDDQKCNMDTISQCIVRFVYVAADTSTVNTCWQAKQTHKCLSTATQHCQSHQIKNMVSMVNALLSQTARESCIEPGCNVPVAKECFEATKAILLSPVGGFQKSPVLCGAMVDMMSCISKNTMNCEYEVYKEMGDHMIQLHEITNKTCQNNTITMSMTQPFVGHIASFYAVATSPFASKETVCPLYYSSVSKMMGMLREGEGNAMDIWYAISMAQHTTGGMCDDKRMCGDMNMEMMMESRCEIQMAQDCVRYGDIMSLVASVDVLGWEVVCHETLKMMECVQHSISGCDMSAMREMEETNKTIHHTLRMVASHCPVEPILAKINCLQPKCDATSAMTNCFKMPNVTTLAAGQAPVMVNETLHCIKQHTAGCAMSPSLLPLGYSKKKYLDYLRPYAYTPPMEMDGKDPLSRMTRCMFKFMEGFENIMSHGKNFSQAMCHLYMSMDKECAKMDDLPSVLQPGMKHQEMIWTGMVEYHCSQMKELPGNCPEIAKDQVGTCVEQCSAMNKCPEGKKCCSNGCGHTCVEPVVDMDSLKELMSTVQESTSCKADEVASYFSNYWLRLMQMAFTPINEMDELCGSFSWFHEYAKANLIGCSTEREMAFNESWGMIEKIHKHVCPVKMIITYNDQEMDQPMCNLDAADMCHDHFMDVLLKTNAYHTDQTCMELVKTFKCMEHAVGSCSMDIPELEYIRIELPFLKAMIGNQCRKHFHGEKFCDMRENIVVKMMNDMMCSKTEAERCYNLFTTAKPMLEHDGKALCRAAKGTTMCVMAKTNNCSSLDNISGGKNVSQIMDEMSAYCPDMEDSSMEEMEDEEDKEVMKRPTEKQCHLLEPMAQCTTVFTPCFNNSFTPSSLCSNAVAIKACMNLAMVGCNDEILTVIRKNVQEDEVLGRLPCDILPDLPSTYKAPGIMLPVECLNTNVTVLREYFKDPVMKDDKKEACEMLPVMADCLVEGVKGSMKADIFMAHRLANTLRQQTFIKCAAEDKILNNMEMLNDTATGYCNTDYAATCMLGVSVYNYFGISSPLADREMLCSTRLTSLQCVQSVVSGCSEVVKARIMHELDWQDGMMQTIGVCSEEKPFVCDPKGALDCISQLSAGHVLSSGTEMESAICAAFGPVEKCVVEKASSCPMNIRASIEQSLVQVSSMARSVCPEMKPDMEEEDKKKGECNMEKAGWCTSQLLNRTSMLLEGQGNKKRTCGEMTELLECADMMSMNCPGHQGKKIDANRPLLKLLVEGACSPDMEENSKEMEHCSMMAGACLTQYLYLAMGSYTGMCSQAIPSLACLRTATEICPSPYKYVVAKAAKHLATVSMEMCGSRGCNSDMAWHCIEDADKYIKAAGSKMLESPMTCGAVMGSLMCAVNHTVHCEKGDNPFLEMSIWSLKVMMDMCPKSHYNEAVSAGQNTTAVEAILPIEILLGLPQLNKETLCPQAKIAMGRFAEMMWYMNVSQLAHARVNSYVMEKIVGTYCYDEDMWKDQTEHQSCNVSMVMQCAKEVDIPSKISTSVFNGWKPVCEATEKLLCCMHNMSSSCFDHKDVYAMIQLGADVMAMVGDHCPLEEMQARSMKCTPRPQPCNTHQALEECYMPLKTRSDVTLLCQNLTEIDYCFQRHLRGCMSSQVAPHANILKTYHSMCNSQADTSSFVHGDQVAASTKCLMGMMEDMSEGFLKETSASKTVCEAISTFSACKGQWENPPPMYTYMTSTGSQNNEHFYKNFCSKAESSTVSVAEQYYCMTEVASMCATSYFTRLTTWMVTPVQDRENVCMELVTVETCVKDALASCSTERQQMYRNIMEMIYFVHEKACPTMPYQQLLLYQDDVCYLETAAMCAEGFGKYLSSTSGHNKQETCRHFGEMIKCLHYSTKNCTYSDAAYDNVVFLVNSANSIMGNTCPLMTAVACDTKNWREIVQRASCDPKAAEKCMMGFSMSLRENMDNDTAMCSMYKKATECAALHTLTCDHSNPQAAMVNQSMYVTMATYGERCMEKYGMTEEQKCWMKEPCTMWIENCLPENSTQICSNVTKIEACLSKQEESCSQDFKLTRAGLIRDFLMMRNVSCDVMNVKGSPPIASPNIIGQCYLDMKNLTEMYFMMENPGHTDICYGLENYHNCVETSSENLHPLWKGMWRQRATMMKQATFTNCKFYERIMMEMMRNDTDENDSDDNGEMRDNGDMGDNSRMMAMNYTEPEDCKPMEAALCMFEYFGMTAFSSYIPLMDRPGTCWWKKHVALPCISNHTMSCSARTRQKFIKMYEVTRRMELAIGMCPEKEQMEMDAGKEDMNNDMMGQCRPQEAAKCMGMLSGAIIGNVGKETSTLICSSIGPVLSCVVEQTWACEKEKRETIERQWNDLYPVAMTTCMMGTHKESPKMSCDAMDPKVKWSCDMPQALMCITSLQSKMMKGDEDLCSGVPDFRSCIYKSLSGCEPTHKEAMKVIVAKVHKRISDRCPKANCDICGARQCLMMFNATKEDMTCFDGWKVKECVNNHVTSCGEEEKNHMMSEMMEKFKKIPETCKDKKALDMCALEFKDITKKLLGLDLKLDWGMEEDDDMEDNMHKDLNKTSDKNMRDPDNTMMDDLTVDMVIKHLLSNKSQCLGPLMGDDKETLCKRATLSWRCVERMVNGLPMNSRDLAMGVMKIVGMAVESACYEKDLSCFKCRNAKSDEECNMLPQQHCNRHSQMCYTMVDDGMITKGCGPKIPYVEHQQCVDNGTKCVYMCHKNDCNMMRHKPVVDPPSCDRKAAMTCGMHMIHNMVTMEEPDCSTLGEGLMCMHEHTKECMSHTDDEMSKMVASLFLTPMMMKCQVKPHYCNCGRCAAVALGKVMYSPFTSASDVCRMAETTQKAVISAVLTDQCTMGELKDLSESVMFAKTVLGDACNSEYERMVPVKYDENCDLEKAMMCLKVVDIRWMLEHREKLGKQAICGSVYKMMGCVQVSTESCASVALGTLNSTIFSTLSNVSSMCNMSLVKELMNPVVTSQEENDAIRGRLLEAIGDKEEMLSKKMSVINSVMKSGVRGEQANCKPSVALNNCFTEMFMTAGTDPNFCSIAKKAWDCQTVMTSQCTPLQHLPVMHAFYSFAAKDSKYCGYPLEPTKDQLGYLMMSPYYNLSVCVGEAIKVQHEAWLHPTAENFAKDCKAAVELDNCVFHQADWSPMAKVARQQFAEMTAEVKRVACMAIPTNMSEVKCEREDILCQILVNMSKTVQPASSTPAVDPPTCNKDLAAFCMANYMSRMFVSPFMPIHDHQFTCRDLNSVKMCIDASVPTCTEPTKQMFQMGYAWMDYMIRPACSMHFDLSESSCMKAGQCLEKFGQYSMRTEKLEQKDFCRQLTKTVECVDHHVYNCTAPEMSYIQKSMYLLGNGSHDWCPEQEERICDISRREARDITKTCDEATMLTCIQTYYDLTYGMELQENTYCSHLMTVSKCIFENSKNCPSQKVREIGELILPGLRSHHVNCTSVDAYALSQMPRCEVKQCNIQYIMYGIMELKENVTKMTEEQKSTIEICNYVSGVITAHLEMVAGCNSLQSYLLQYIKDKALDQYLNNCPANIVVDLPAPAVDDVTKLQNCFSNLDTSMGTAIKSPKYGFLDICQVMYGMHRCFDGVYADMGTSPVLDTAMIQLNHTANSITEFLRDQCSSSSFNISMLVELTGLPAESADCKVDTAMNCVKLLTVKNLAAPVLMENKDMFCRDVQMLHECVEDNVQACSPVLKSQLVSVFSLNLQMIGDKCKLNMTDETPKDKAREMYSNLVQIMMMGENRMDKSERQDMDMERNNMMNDDESDNDRMNEDDDESGEDDSDENDEDDSGESSEEDSGESNEEEDDDNDDDEDNMERRDDMDKPICNIYMANECMMSALANFDMYAPRICRQNSKYLPECIRPHVEPCDNMTKMMVHYSEERMMVLFKKSCQTYMWWAKYLGGDQMMKNDMEVERRNAMEMSMEREMNSDEMKQKRQADVDEVFSKMNKIGQIVNFIRAADNPFEMMNSESADLMEMFKKISKMSANDMDCIKEGSFEGQGHCSPSMALECARAVEEELMSPWATKHRICLKFSLAVRCAMMTSQGCDHMTTSHLHMRFHEVMGHVGNMCPTVVKESCEVKTECKAMELPSCVTPLHSKIMASLQLPTASTVQLCSYIEIAAECIMEKVEKCPEQVIFKVHESLKPSLGMLGSMCMTLPGQACFTSMVWNLGSLVLLDANIHKTGAMHTMLEVAKMYNKTIDMSGWMTKKNQVNVSEEYLKTITLLHKMMEMNRNNCSYAELMGDKDRKDNMMDMGKMEGSLMDGLLQMVKYAMMNDDVIQKDEQMIKMMRIMMLNLDKDQSMQDLLDQSAHIIKEIHERYDDKTMKKMNISVVEVMNEVIKIIVGMGNGHEIVSSAYHTLAYMKIGEMMDQINAMVMKEDEMEYFNRWDYLNKGLVENMKERSQQELTKAAMGLMDIYMEPNNSQNLEGLMMMMKVKKMTTCADMMEVAHCAMSNLPLLPKDKRHLMNATLQALATVATEVCMGQKCYECKGVKDNMECNKQGVKMCEAGQGCFTLLKDDTLHKGCMYPLYGYTFGEDWKFCQGSMCNKHKYMVEEEKDMNCKPMAALMCLAGMVPIIAAEGHLDERMIYSNFACIEKHTSTCSMSNTRMMADLVPMLKHGLYESQCSGDKAGYECGTRSIIGLGMTVMDPAADRMGVCSQLNDTFRMLDQAVEHKKCSDYEKAAAFKGIKSIMQTIGPDYCPGVMPSRKIFCENVTSTVCNKSAALQCFTKYKVMEQVKDMMTDMENTNLCWKMTELLVCMGEATAGCKPTDDVTEVFNTFKEKVGYAISHCPILQMNLDICYPELKKPSVCQPALVYTMCIQPLTDDGCSAIEDDNKRHTLVNCISDLTTGCSHMQNLPVYNSIHFAVTEYLMGCGNHSVTEVLMTNRATRVDHAMARMAALVMTRSMIMKVNEPTSDMAVSSMFHKLMSLRLNVTGAMGPLGNMSSNIYMKAKELFKELTEKRMGIQDDTGEIVMCALQFETQATVAMAFPSMFDAIYCESLHQFVKCLSKSEGQTVPMMFAMSMRDQFAGYMEGVCHNYMDKMVDISKTIMGTLGYNENSTEMDMSMISDGQWKELLGHLQKEGDQCDTWYIAAYLANVASYALSGPFKTQETYSIMCLIMDNLNATLKDKIDQCSEDHRMVYYGIIEGLKTTNPVCHNPVMNITKPTTCQLESAGYCIASAMPWLSSQATPDYQLCWHLSRAVTCVHHSTEHCSDGEKTYFNGLLSYIQTIVGNRCPLLTSLVACSDSSSMVGAKCSVKDVHMCVDAWETCSDVKTTTECINRNSYNCSAYEMKQITGFVEMTWMNILKVCPEKDIVAEAYSKGSCSAPPTCSLAEAYNCSMKYDSTDCSHMANIKTCFEQHTRGCSNLQFMMGKATLDFYQRTKYPLCTAITPTVPAYAGDVTDFNRIYQCVDKYVKGSPVAMMSTMPFKNGCDAFWEFLTCMGTGVSADEAAWAGIFAGQAFNTTVEFMMRFCSLPIMDEAEVADPDDKCDRNMAGQCLTMSSLHVMLSSVMTISDKKALCSKSISPMVNCATTLMGCANTTSNAVRSAHAIQDYVKMFSGVCSDELWICSPEDAMFCGTYMNERIAKMVEMSPRRMNSTDMIDEGMNEELCRVFDETMHCTQRFTFACSQEVAMYVKQSVATSVCLGYDLFKRCPSVTMVTSVDLPKCMSDNDKEMDDDRKDEMNDKDNIKTDERTTRTKRDAHMEDEEEDDSTCSLDKAMECVGMMYYELLGPFLDCSRFHRTYVKTMNCVHESTKDCMKMNPSAAMLSHAISNMTIQQVYMKCPSVVMTPCREPDNCAFEKAGACYWRFTQHFNNTKIGGEELCLSSEVAKYCSMEHTKQCSIFSQSTFPQMIDEHLKSRHIDCSPSSETCLHKYQITAMGILHGDLTMAAMAKKKEQMTLRIADMMMNKDNMGEMMDNATRMMSIDEKKMADAFFNFSTLSKYADNKTLQLMKSHIESLASLSEMDDPMAMYTKVKMLQCVGFNEAWSCLMDKGDEAGLSPEVVHVLNETMGMFYSMVSGMCSRVSVLYLMEEPETCQILPAAMTFMNQIQKLTIPDYGLPLFCQTNELSAAIDKVKEYSDSCSDEIQGQFDKLNGVVEVARDTLCRAKGDCMSSQAQQCVNTLKTQQDCSTYETTHACVEVELKFCNASVSNTIRQELQQLYTQLSCEKLPAIKVPTSVLRLLEGGTPTTLEITVEEDPALWCANGQTCEIKFDLDIESGNEKCKDGSNIPQIVVADDTGSCQRTITTQNWNTPISYTLLARVDSRYDNSHNLNINITAHKFVDGTKVLTRVISRLEAVVVNTDQQAMCTSMGGNQLSSFDGLFETIRYQGEFIVYKNKEFPQEVHTLYQTCSPTDSNLCICAVMVRVGDDSLTIDKCRRSGQTGVIAPSALFYKSGQIAEGFRIYVANNGQIVRLMLPTGTIVSVDISDMQLSILPSSLDWLRSEGLCGSYDANKFNDAMSKDGTVMSLVNNAAPDQFASSWRVSVYESLFSGVRTVSTLNYKSYCTCPADSSAPVCKEMRIVESCDLVSGVDVTSTIEGTAVNQDNSQTRKKRQTVDPLSGLDVDYTYIAPEATWSNNWNETSARQHCESLLTGSSLGQLCTAATGYTFQAEVDACIQNIKMNGHTNSLGSYVEAMKTKCVAQIDKNLPSLSSDPALLATILSHTCPNDCSTHGTCTDQGTCTCYGDWVSADCSVSRYAEPTVISLRDGDVCDSNSCNSVFVLGQNFIEQATLSCHYQSQGDQPIKVAAQFITSSMVQCQALPVVAAYKQMTISVTNSGDLQKATGTLGLAVYHPGCYSCANYQTCQQLTTGCMLGGVCYHGNAVNPGNSCQRCIPEISVNAWTNVIGGSCVGYLSTPEPPITPPTTPPAGGSTQSPAGNKEEDTSDDDNDRVVYIVLGCLAGGFALISLFLACKVCTSKEAEIKRKSPSYSPSASDSASNKDYDNARAFDNLGYSYSQPYAEKQPAVDDLPPPTNIIVDAERSHL
ncbi:uncharacterized protein LOC127735918 isoform X2 [Mytilus californianus]|uniref:uncharacterized protein LOC127735918 isoform X2 n=1 Tax=Mytilus californianus TaxID=6549 RepID=UPI0022475419|nr:uncharacterized protein LOC127735918 isoform X2 [Mytilus californianus]